MKNHVAMRSRILMSALVLMTCGSLAAWSQEAAKTKAAKPTAAADDKKPTNRLPANYGKLGLTDAQRDKVYAIQDKYGKQIDDLKAQIKALDAKQDGEIEAVLSAEQKKILKDLTDEAKDKAAAAKAKKSDAKEPDKNKEPDKK